MEGQSLSKNSVTPVISLTGTEKPKKFNWKELPRKEFSYIFPNISF